jgi:hypothetical protein
MKNTFHTQPTIQEESSNLILNTLSKPTLKNLNLDKKSRYTTRTKKKTERSNDSYGIIHIIIKIVNIINDGSNWDQRNSSNDKVESGYNLKNLDNRHLQSVTHSDKFFGIVVVLML